MRGEAVEESNILSEIIEWFKGFQQIKKERGQCTPASGWMGQLRDVLVCVWSNKRSNILRPTFTKLHIVEVRSKKRLPLEHIQHPP